MKMPASLGPCGVGGIVDIPRCPEGYWIPGFGAQERGLGRRWYLKLEGQIKSPRKCVWCKKRSQEDPIVMSKGHLEKA